jgi:hypothetical protein
MGIHAPLHSRQNAAASNSRVNDPATNHVFQMQVKKNAFQDNRPVAVMQRQLQQLADIHQKTIQKASLEKVDGSGMKVIQRKGVKEELSEAERKFSDFMDETALIDETRTEVANAIYSAYKPESMGKRNHFSDKVAHNGVNPSFNHGVAFQKASRLNHWTQNSINAASRIYEELIAATDYNDDKGIGLEEITFGMDTDTEPDVFLTNDTALESKYIDSGAQGSVDTHIKKVSEQLDKRKFNKIFNKKKPVAVTKWIAHINISNPDNPWPYTPVAYKKAVKSKKVDAKSVGKKRIKKYQNASELINYRVQSANPNIGKFSVNA